MQLIPSASFEYAKQACYVCRKGGPLVDLGVYIEGEGALAICDSCAFDAAKTAGHVIRRRKAQ